jgi:tryptophan synthase alpha chain
MGYLNPVEAMGYHKFAASAAEAGVDGLLTVDMPPEESTDLRQALKVHHIDPIFLLSPTTQPMRIEKITSVGSGFLYYVSLKGVTGANVLDVDDVALHVNAIKKMSDLPIGVGFGIKTAADAGAVANVADAVVVGSSIVKIIENNIDDAETIMDDIGDLLTGMRTAMDS